MDIGNVVLFCDENLDRNDWCLARVFEKFTSSDNLVQSVKLLFASSELDQHGIRMSEPTF